MTEKTETVHFTVTGTIKDLSYHTAEQAADALARSLDLCDTERDQVILIIGTLSIFVAKCCALADVENGRGARVPNGAETLESVFRSAKDLIPQFRENLEKGL